MWKQLPEDTKPKYGEKLSQLRYKARRRRRESRRPLNDDQSNGSPRDILREYNGRDVKAINRHLRGLRSALELAEDNVITTLFGGSVKKHTYVEGLSDIDALAVINESSLVGRPDTDGYVANRAGGLFRVRPTRRPGRPELGMRRFPAALEPVALTVHFEDVDVVGEAVQQCAGQPFRAEDLGSLVEGQVGGHQYRAPLAALVEDLEEQLGPGGGKVGLSLTRR